MGEITRSEPLGAPGDIIPAFVAAWASRSGAAIAALFTEDAEFVNVTGLWWQGRQAIAKPHDYALGSFFADTTLRPGRKSVRLVGETAAVVRCRFTLSGQKTPDGNPARERQTILTFVMEKHPEGWLAIAAQNTDVVPGKETFVAGPDGLTATDYRKP